MERASRFWTILLLTVCIADCSGAPTRAESVGRGDYAKVAEYASKLIRHEMKKGDVTGLSIALVDDQRVVWAAGFGYADKAGNVPASPDTIYRAGSISKIFTATAAMQLAERGRFDIDHPLADLSPRVLDPHPLRRCRPNNPPLHHDPPFGPSFRFPEGDVDTGSRTVHPDGGPPQGRVCGESARRRIFLLQPGDDPSRGRDREGGRPRLRIPRRGHAPSPARDDPFLLFHVGRPVAFCGEGVPEREGGGGTAVARRSRRRAEHERGRP